MSNRTLSAIDKAAIRLREIALGCPEGELLGSEEALVEKLGVSRVTVRQVARLLEREGLLKVRRGINGGYFAGRPNLETVEAAVSAYLDTLDMEAEDVTVIASVLWVEAVRKAASLGTEAASAMAQKFRARVMALKPTATFTQVLKVDQEVQAEVFALTKARYIELIFQINIAFSRKRFAPTSLADDTEVHREFVDAWRKAKLMELDAILDRDPELGTMAARHSRNLWHRRIWSPAGAERPSD
ncbi:GntR family transcriptional regulator [Phenylobacterium sp. LjRoot225]|uniref:GntR family transcriptional regulator n=1 Tax=Phenylobacterium sp. LjRoot225 TaxID=3342285 RepID=UPI003ECFA628